LEDEQENGMMGNGKNQKRAKAGKRIPVLKEERAKVYFKI